MAAGGGGGAAAAFPDVGDGIFFGNGEAAHEGPYASDAEYESYLRFLRLKLRHHVCVAPWVLRHIQYWNERGRDEPAYQLDERSQKLRDALITSDDVYVLKSFTRNGRLRLYKLQLGDFSLPGQNRRDFYFRELLRPGQPIPQMHRGAYIPDMDHFVFVPMTVGGGNDGWVLPPMVAGITGPDDPKAIPNTDFTRVTSHYTRRMNGNTYTQYNEVLCMRYPLLSINKDVYVYCGKHMVWGETKFVYYDAEDVEVLNLHARHVFKDGRILYMSRSICNPMPTRNEHDVRAGLDFWGEDDDGRGGRTSETSVSMRDASSHPPCHTTHESHIPSQVSSTCTVVTIV